MTSSPTLGLMADLGLPDAIAARIADDVAARLTAATGTPWSVEISRETLSLTPQGEIALWERAPLLLERNDWAYVVYLTDLPPPHEQGNPVVGEVSTVERAALVCLPALGAFRVAQRTRELVVTLVRSAATGTTEPSARASIQAALGERHVRRIPASGRDDVSCLVLEGPFRRLRTLGGMVRNNRPGRLLTVLTGCIAVGAGTGAFGIFYGSIWNLSDALHPLRLFAISLLATAILTGWLIVGNGLWNRRRREDEPGLPWLDNAATVLTVGISAALVYLVLFASLLGLGVVIVDAGYLSSELGKPAVPGDYLDLAWLSASLGTLAGAVGSNFDREDAIREATYSRRWHERRQMFDSYEERDER